MEIKSGKTERNLDFFPFLKSNTWGNVCWPVKFHLKLCLFQNVISLILRNLLIFILISEIVALWLAIRRSLLQVHACSYVLYI